MRHFHAAVALGAWALSPALLRAENLTAVPLEVALFDDDQCAAGDEACALNAMQLRGRRSEEGAESVRGEWAWPYTCHNFGACGRFVKWQPCQCNWQCNQYHNCCSDYVSFCIQHRPPPTPAPRPPPPTPPPPTPAPPAPQPLPQPAPGPTPESPSPSPTPITPTGKWEPDQKILLEPSRGKLLTYYMYRAQSNTSYPLENVNTANLPGVLWYIQNEIVSGKWGTTDRFGVSMIKRFKVQTRATQTLVNKKMNFGVRVAFDSGMCTNKVCDYSWWLYGYNVGCNKLGEYPFPMFETYYPGGIWYSLPGPCPTKHWNQHNATCEGTQPGGRCQGTPTGAGDCTYSYEDAGYVTLAEIYEAHGGSGQAFWAGESSYQANSKKIQVVTELFDKKYPDMPSIGNLPDPPCDFDKTAFFKCDICA